MLRKTVIFISLLLGLALADIVPAQTVDPCQYGCPKEGCGCPDEGGGPIETEESDSDDDESGEDSDDDDSDEDSSGDLPA